MQDNTVTVSDILNDDTKCLKNIFISDTNADDQNNDLETDMGNCQYFTETELTNYLTINKISDQTHLKLLSLNIANVISKLRSLKVLIQSLSKASNRPNIITVTETHLSNFQNHGYTSLELENIIPGYKFFHRNRSNKRGGGVGIFIEDAIAENAVVECDDFFVEQTFESISICIPNFSTPAGSKNLIVASIYRQPNDGNLKRFLDLLETWLQTHDN